MLEKLLSSNNQKEIVGVSLTPGIGLEAVLYNKATNTILKYGKRKLDYNFSTREIQDYTKFKTALGDLMVELQINPKTMAYMVLPNVYFDFIELPSGILDAEIKTALLSKAEEFYVFKREEPVSGWAEVLNPDGDGQKRYVYSSFQKSDVNQIRDTFSDIGLHLVGIESSYSATLRGLYLTGLIDDVITEQASWTAMIINTNSYTLLQMDGQNLLECTEVPLAIKSFSTEEAYQAILSSSSQLLYNFSSQKLYIISQTEDISASALKSSMDFEGEIVAIDTNKYADIEKMFVETAEGVNRAEAKSLTLGCIGASCVKTDFKLVLNVLADDPSASMGVYCTWNIMGNEYDITSEVVTKLTIVLSVGLLTLFAAVIGLFYFINFETQKVLDKAKNQIQQLDAEIDTLSQYEPKQEIDMNIIIDDIANLNVTANNFYDSIATDIPQNIWLTKYFNQGGDKIVIQGIAEDITAVYKYYEDLRVVAPQSNIKLTGLKVVTSLDNLGIKSDADRLYSFEISNTDIDFESAVNAVVEGAKAVTDEDIIIKSNRASSKGGNTDTAPVEEPSEQMKPAE